MAAERAYQRFLHKEKEWGKAYSLLDTIKDGLRSLNVQTNRALFRPPRPATATAAPSSSSSSNSKNAEATALLVELCGYADVRYHHLGEFLKRSADPNAQTDLSGDAPLHRLIRAGGNAECMQLLLDWGAQPHAPNKRGQTPLMVACDAVDASPQRLQVVRLLLQRSRRAEINAFDHGGRSAAILAAARGNVWVLRELLLAGASALLRKDGHGDGEAYQSLVEMAARCRDEALAAAAAEGGRQVTSLAVRSAPASPAANDDDDVSNSDGDNDSVDSATGTPRDRGGYLKGGRRIPKAKRRQHLTVRLPVGWRPSPAATSGGTASADKEVDYTSHATLLLATLTHRPEEIVCRMVASRAATERRETHNEALRRRRGADGAGSSAVTSVTASDYTEASSAAPVGGGEVLTRRPVVRFVGPDAGAEATAAAVAGPGPSTAAAKKLNYATIVQAAAVAAGRRPRPRASVAGDGDGTGGDAGGGGGGDDALAVPADAPTTDHNDNPAPEPVPVPEPDVALDDPDVAWRVDHRRRLEARRTARKAAKDELVAAAAYEEMYVRRLARAKALDGSFNENPYNKHAPRLTHPNDMEMLVKRQHEEHLKRWRDEMDLKAQEMMRGYTHPTPFAAKGPKGAAPVSAAEAAKARDEAAGPEEWAAAWNAAKPRAGPTEVHAGIAAEVLQAQGPDARAALRRDRDLVFAVPGTATALLRSRKARAAAKLLTADEDEKRRVDRQFRRRTRNIQRRLASSHGSRDTGAETAGTAGGGASAAKVSAAAAALGFGPPTGDGGARGPRVVQVKGMDEDWFAPGEVDEYKHALAKTAKKMGIKFDPNRERDRFEREAAEEEAGGGGVPARSVFDTLSDSEDEDDDDGGDHRGGGGGSETRRKQQQDDDDDGSDSDRRVRFAQPAFVPRGVGRSLNDPYSAAQRRLELRFNVQSPPRRASAPGTGTGAAAGAGAPAASPLRPAASPLGAGAGAGSGSGPAPSPSKAAMSPSRAILVGSRSERRAALPEVPELPETRSPDSDKWDSPPEVQRGGAGRGRGRGEADDDRREAATKESEERYRPRGLPPPRVINMR